MPTGAQFFTSFSAAVQGTTTEKTFCSRIRRAMSWVYCAPKSRITMDWFSGDWLRLDWDSTDEFLKSKGWCKGRVEGLCESAGGDGDLFLVKSRRQVGLHGEGLSRRREGVRA